MAICPQKHLSLGVRDPGDLINRLATASPDSFPGAGRDDLIEAVRAAGTMQFGQLTLSLSAVYPTYPTMGENTEILSWSF